MVSEQRRLAPVRLAGRLFLRLIPVLFFVIASSGIAGAAGDARPGGIGGGRQGEGAVLRVEGLSVDPVEARAGEPATVAVTVANAGDEDGTYALDLLVDGEAGPGVEGALPPGGERTHYVQVVRNALGTHTVAAGDILTSYTINPASFSVADFRVSPPLARPGDPIWVEGRVVNTGGVAGAYRLQALVSGRPGRELEGFLAAGEREPFAFTLVAPESGVHTVSVGAATGSFGVVPHLVDVGLVDRVEILPVTATAVDDRGAPATVSGREVRIERTSAGLLAVQLPALPGEGRTLASFHDTTTGVHYGDGRLQLRFPGPRGAPAVRLLGEMPPPEGMGTVTRGVAGDLRLQVDGVDVDMSLVQGGPGRVGVSMDLALRDFTPGGAMVLHARKEPGPARRAQIETEARDQGLSIAAVALDLELEMVGTGRVLDVSETELRVELEREWLSGVGGSRAIRVAWENGEGAVGLVPVETAGRGGPGRDLLVGRVPHGVASLAVLAVAPYDQDAVQVSGLAVTPAVLTPGGTALVSATVEGTGSGTVVAPITMTVDDEPRRTQTVSLGAGETRTVEFLAVFDVPGEYRVGVDGTTGTVRVAPPLDPASVRIDELRVTPREGPAGAPATVSVLAVNTGADLGVAAPRLLVNGVPGVAVPVLLEPGGQAQGEVALLRDRPGTYEVRVGGLEAAFSLYAVDPPPSFVVSDLAVDPGAVNPGQEATVSFMLVNRGGAGTFRESLFVGDDEQPIGPIPLEAFTTIPVKETLTAFTSGTYVLAIGGAEATLYVREARETEFRVAGLEIEPSTVPTGAAVRVSVTATNEEAFVGTDELTLRVDGVAEEAERLWLGPGVSQRVTFEYVVEQPGEYAVDVNGVFGTLVATKVFPLKPVLGAAVSVLLVAGTALVSLRRFRSGALPAG